MKETVEKIKNVITQYEEGAIFVHEATSAIINIVRVALEDGDLDMNRCPDTDCVVCLNAISDKIIATH